MIVPDVVIGPPEKLRPVVPPETSTEVTEPAAPAEDASSLTVPAVFLK